MRAYELVPEAYRQKFRTCEKTANQTYVEFARKRSVLLDKWCSACKVTKFDQLRELILLEEFKKCLPERIVVYLNKQKVETVSKAAVCADEFVSTHRAVFPSVRREHFPVAGAGKNPKVQPKTPLRSSPSPSDSRECFYCHELGHLIAHCPTLLRRDGQNSKRPKSVGLVQSAPTPLISPPEPDDEVDECYKPFIHKGSVSLTGEDEDQVPIVILRDTGATQSLMLQGVLPFSEQSFHGSDSLVLGVEMNVLRAPLHTVFLRSPIVSGPVKIDVRARLPIRGVALILGNELAGEKVFPTPEVVDNPVPDSSPSVSAVFPACAVTRAQSRKFDEVLNLSDSFLCPVDDPVKTETAAVKAEKVVNLLPTEAELALEVDCSVFIEAQQSDPTLAACVTAAASDSEAPVYCVVDGILIRNWFPLAV